MKDSVDVTQKAGFVAFSDRFGSAVNTTGLAERTYVAFTGSSVSNPYPRVFKMSYLTYLKKSITNFGIRTLESGFYTQQGYTSNSLVYGRLGAHSVYSDSIPVSVNYEALYGSAIDKLLDKVKGANVNLSVDVAERQQTYRMLKAATSLRSLISEFVKQITSTREWRKRRGKSRDKYVSSKWLEYRYGWSPLVSTVYDAAETVMKMRGAGIVRVSARTAQAIRIDTESGLGTYLTPMDKFKSEGMIRGQIVVLMKSKESVSIQDFTTLNPVLLAWELLPYSFIVDWFVNISGYLQASETSFQYANQFVCGCYTVSRSENRSLIRFGSTSIAPQYYVNNGDTFVRDGATSITTYGGSTVSVKSCERIPIFSLPTPLGPRVKPVLSSNKMLDIAALVSTAFKRAK